MFGVNKKYKLFGNKTMLIYAALHNNAKAVNYLIKNKADITVKDKKGMTALDYANKNNNEEIIRNIKHILKGKWEFDEEENIEEKNNKEKKPKIKRSYARSIYNIIDKNKASTSGINYMKEEHLRKQKNDELMKK